MKGLKYFISMLLTAFLIGCTTKSDTYYNRQFRMIPTMYNVLYNGNLALAEGQKEIAQQHNENYFEILPVEPETLSGEYFLKGEGNPLFDRAEEKAIKAIQRHSMVFDGKQKNRKIDDAYMLLGKARYYNGRYIPALEAFNHLLTNYGETNQRYNAAVWREKAHIQLDREELAVADLQKILTQEKPKRKERANLHAVLAQAFINLKEYPKAIEVLKLASVETRNKAQKGRYLFITAQLFETLQQKDSAQVYFQKVIDLNWKIPRRLWVEAQVGKARTQDLSPEEKVAYLEQLRKMEKLYEHKDLLDLIYFQHALYLERERKTKGAIDYYVRSLEKNKDNKGLKKQTNEHLAELYFKEKKYPLAYAHYDSTLVYIPKNSLEYLYMRRKRDNLTQITAFENTIAKVDSISSIMVMNQEEKEVFFQKYLDAKRIDSKKEPINITNFGRTVRNRMQSPQDGFYFYVPQAVSYGKQLFTEQFGDRPLVDNWRYSSLLVGETDTDKGKEVLAVVQPTLSEFIEKLPNAEQMSQLEREREDALYGVGELYWEKFKEGTLAQERLNRLLSLTSVPLLREKALYQLYKINEQNPSQAETFKKELLAQYPNSVYTKIISGEVSSSEKELQEQRLRLEEMLERQQYQQVLSYIDTHTLAYKLSPQAPDWEILRAKALARLEGKDVYMQELDRIAKEYPNTKQADYVQKTLSTLKSEEKKPAFEPDERASSWKIVVPIVNEKNIKQLKSYLEEKGFAYVTLSEDVYDAQQQWTVLHGFMSRPMAEGFVERYTQYQEEEAKDKKIAEKNEDNSLFFENYFVISSENYQIMQAYKNKEEYIKK